MSTKPNYDFKAHCLKNESALRKKIKKSRKYTGAMQLYFDTGIVLPIIRFEIDDIFHLREKCYQEGKKQEFDELMRIENADSQRVKRLKGRINDMLIQEDCQFITLTFKDSVLNETTADERRRFVRDFLKRECNTYVANIDFGSKNHREHYHAVGTGLQMHYKKWHKYGAIKCIPIYANNAAALAKYVAKLTNHAIKETTKRSALIYSR